MTDNIISRFKSGVIWSIIGQFGFLGIGFITNIFLARILSPEEFGVIAIATFFISLSSVLIESGLGGALVRKIDVTEKDYSTIFIFNLSVSVCLFFFLLFVSDYVEDFYKIDSLALYLKVLSITLIVNSLRIINHTKQVKALNYKLISKYSIISVIIASSSTIICGLYGYGVWSLIIFYILNSGCLTILYLINTSGVKILRFSMKSFRELYSFGLFITLSSLLNTGFNNIYQLILGKSFSVNQTGLYDQSHKLTAIPVGIINSLTQGVVFSFLSNLQEDKDKFDFMYNNIIRLFTVIVGLISILIFNFSKEILYIFYGERWLDASFYMKILSIGSFFYMQEMFNRILFKVYNKTSYIFYLEIIKKILQLATILLGLFYKSLEILMYGYIITSILSYFINYYFSRKIYKSKSQISEMRYAFKTFIIMGIVSSVFYLVSSLFDIGGLIYLLMFPFVIVIFFLLLRLLKVVDFKRDVEVLLNLKK